MAEERDDLKTRFAAARSRNEYLEVEVKKMDKEIEDLARENNSLNQSNTLLGQDKEYHTRQIRYVIRLIHEWDTGTLTRERHRALSELLLTLHSSLIIIK